MFTGEFERLEAQFYREMNRVVGPLARIGFGSPTLLWPTGIIVLEIKGRKTGRMLTVPLLATRIGDSVLVGTVRHNSQWLKNLAAHPEVRYWLAGYCHEATAVMLARNLATLQSDQLPLHLDCFVTALRPYSRIFGGGAALLIPRRSQDEERSSW